MHTLLEPAAILDQLNTSALPATVRCYGQVGSTMDLCREALAQLSDAELPLLLVAEEQLAGRGRRGRNWVAPPGSALLFSLAMRPPALAAARATALVWMAGVALSEGINDALGLQAQLKWPNDLLVGFAPGDDWRKVAGILLEASSDEQGVQWAILGCGINVRACPPPTAVRYPAGHLEAALGRTVDRLALLRAMLRRLDFWYQAIIDGRDEQLFAAWQSRLHTLGRAVSIETNTGTVSGRAEAVDRSGALLVRDEAGRLQTISNGDVGLFSSPPSATG